MATVIDGFEDLDALQGKIKPEVAEGVRRVDEGLVSVELLAEFMGSIDMVEDWCKAVRGRVEAELFAGSTVPGYKLVEGRRGNRAWQTRSCSG